MIEADDGARLAQEVGRAFRRGSSPEKDVAFRHACYANLIGDALDYMTAIRLPVSAETFLEAFECVKEFYLDDLDKALAPDPRIVSSIRIADPVRLADTAASLLEKGKTEKWIVELTREASKLWIINRPLQK